MQLHWRGCDEPNRAILPAPRPGDGVSKPDAARRRAVFDVASGSSLNVGAAHLRRLAPAHVESRPVLNTFLLASSCPLWPPAMPSLPQFNPLRLRSYILRLPLATRLLVAAIVGLWVATIPFPWLRELGSLSPDKFDLTQSACSPVSAPSAPCMSPAGHAASVPMQHRKPRPSLQELRRRRMASPYTCRTERFQRNMD